MHRQLVSRLNELSKLKKNWDTYNAHPISKKSLKNARSVLDDLLDKDTPIPAIAPTSDGGVQIEWHYNGIVLEIMITEASYGYFYKSKLEEKEKYSFRQADFWFNSIEDFMDEIKGFLKQLR